MANRAAYKTFRPGDRVTVRRAVKSGKCPECVVLPGMIGVVDRMEQLVWVRFSEFPILWWMYDGNLILVSRPAMIAE